MTGYFIINSGTIFTSKTLFSKFLQTSGVVYKLQCELSSESYYWECVRHLTVRNGEHIGILPSTN